MGVHSTRRDSVVHAHLNEVYKRLYSGESSRMIGAELGISGQAVTYYLRRWTPRRYGRLQAALRTTAEGRRAHAAECKRVANLSTRGRETFRYESELERRQGILFSYKAYNAKRHAGGWDLQRGDIVFPSHCPVLGIELDYFGAYSDNSPSFDRTDSTKGYVKGNVQVISWRANRIKNNGTADEHQRIADYMRALNG